MAFRAFTGLGRLDSYDSKVHTDVVVTQISIHLVLGHRIFWHMTYLEGGGGI